MDIQFRDEAVKNSVKMASIEAVVIGVDGKPKRNLGVVAYYHRNPLMRLGWKVMKFLKGEPR